MRLQRRKDRADGLKMSPKRKNPETLLALRLISSNETKTVNNRFSRRVSECVNVCVCVCVYVCVLNASSFLVSGDGRILREIFF